MIMNAELQRREATSEGRREEAMAMRKATLR